MMKNMIFSTYRFMQIYVFDNQCICTMHHKLTCHKIILHKVWEF